MDEFVDEEMEPDPGLNQVTNAIIGACIAVHRELGPAYSEEIYEEALSMEFDARGIQYSRQHPIEVVYRDKVIGTGRVDFVVEGQVVVEIKAIEQLAPVHTAQVISYLRTTRCKLGMLINFRTKMLKDGIRRVAG
jgi:GxxExxY protein